VKDLRPWLLPFGALFGGAAALRAALYGWGAFERHRLEGPVISVGNLRVGGTGKTPLVIRCAEILRDGGVPVSILSRGYGGSFRGDCLIVGDGTSVRAGFEEAGDEPVMIAHSLPGVVVAVGRRRDRAGRIVESRFGPRVHLLDDGFQHLRLARDLDVLCLGSGDLHGSPLPAGNLREFPSAERRAHLVLVPKGEPVTDPSRMFRFGRRVIGFFGQDGSPRPAPSRAFLLSGIASPERFHADVRDRVGEVAGILAFPDHHRYGVDDFQGILETARKAGAGALVTTAKDAVRLREMRGDLPVLILRIAAEIDDEERFAARLLSVARRAG
jgi:tetraacyldisaccharide 4'-kinase